MSITNFRTGFVAVMGRPNVGKSTLINALLGQKIAAVSPKPQTTRKRQLGILTTQDTQIVFVDTPGIHNPHHKLGKAMNQTAIQALTESDAILLVIDISQKLQSDDQLLIDTLKQSQPLPPVLIAANKVDLVADDLTERFQNLAELVPHAEVIPLSAKTGQQLAHLIALLREHLPESPPFFPEDQITDLYEKELAADLLREAALNMLQDEVPHSLAIRIDQFTERGDRGAYIAATLFVERNSQKGIVIGQGGKMLKKIGSAARQSIEEMSGRKIFLELRVKVRKNWRDDPNILRLFGFQLEEKKR